MSGTDEDLDRVLAYSMQLAADDDAQLQKAISLSLQGQTQSTGVPTITPLTDKDSGPGGNSNETIAERLDRELAMSLTLEDAAAPVLPGDGASKVFKQQERDAHARSNTDASQPPRSAPLDKSLWTTSDSDDALARLVSGNISVGADSFPNIGRNDGHIARRIHGSIVPNHARSHAVPLSTERDLPSYEELRDMPVVVRGLEVSQRQRLRHSTYAQQPASRSPGKARVVSGSGDGQRRESGTYQCAICLAAFQGHDEVTLLPCDHFFHSPCADEWFKVSKKCPLCSKEV